MKARVRKILVELKSMKKGNRSITKYVLRVKTILNSLLIIGNVISEQDYIHSILGSLPEEYSLFSMQMYGNPEPLTLFYFEALLYVHETYLDKFNQELVVWSVTSNVAHINEQTSRMPESLEGN